MKNDFTSQDRLLDVQVCKLVFKRKCHEIEHSDGVISHRYKANNHIRRVPNYSTVSAVSHMVIEKCLEMGMIVTIWRTPIGFHVELHYLSKKKLKTAETLPKAICLAAVDFFTAHKDG